MLIVFTVQPIGTTGLSIPLLTVGTGTPRVSIVLGIHGNETTWHSIIQQLLKTIHLEQGTLQIILQANPVAGLEHRRCFSIDGKDLNRTFPGNPSGTITEQTAHTILDILEKSDAVIDLHTFNGMQTPVMGILIDGGTRENEELVRQFSPTIVWRLQPSRTDETPFQHSLGTILNKKLIPNIAIETNGSEHATPDDIQHCVEGLQRILHSKGMIANTITNEPPRREQQPRHFHRTIITTPTVK